MEITLINETDNQEYDLYETDFAAIAEITMTLLSLSNNYNLSVIYCNDEYIHHINKQYRHIDAPTDVITFALKDSAEEMEGIEELDQELGDIFLNLQAVGRQAKEYGHSEKREICFLFTHGLLHLLGFDHIDSEQEKRMFKIQSEIIDSYIPRSQ